MSYTGPWRNRMRNLYVQYAFLDELVSCDPRLARALEADPLCFDDAWTYKKTRQKDRDRRPVVIRYPVWWADNEHRKVENGDVKARRQGQKLLS